MTKNEKHNTWYLRTHVNVAVLMFEDRVWDCNLTARWYDRKAVLYMVRDKFLNTCELAISGSNLQQMNDHSYEYE